MSMSFLLGLAAVLILVVLILMFRVQGLLSIVRGSDNKSDGMMNRFNAAMLLIFAVVGTFVFVYYSFSRFDDYNLPTAVSEHGIETDKLFWVTTGIISIVFIIVNFLLMFFAFKYQYKEGQKAKYFPDHHLLELTWTVIPAIVLTYLVFNGWQVWSKTMSEPAPQLLDDKVEIEVVGQQFFWNVRYPGNDEQLGAHYFRNIDADNSFGLKVTDANSWDDFMPRQIVIPKGRKVHFVIRAKDVLHSVYLPHFRVKMDAMPGMPTQFWFTPTFTTKEMRNKLDDQTFNYEMACAEMCGKGHYSMRYEVVVLENDEYEEWLKESTKSSWALEKTSYVLTNLVKQGAPAATISDFIKFINKKDAELAKVGVLAYFEELKKVDPKKGDAKVKEFIELVATKNSNLGSWLSSLVSHSPITLEQDSLIIPIVDTLSSNEVIETKTVKVVEKTSAKKPLVSVKLVDKKVKVETSVKIEDHPHH